MERFRSQNLHLPTSNDLDEMQEHKEDAIRARVTDTRSWGILRDNAFPSVLNIPASSTNPAPNLREAIGEFTVRFDTDNGLVSVGLGSTSASTPPVVGGLAYDLNGERIAILDDAAFDFSNAIPEGQKNSGNLSIPLTLTGTSGGSGTNPSVLGTYYLWIEYLEINDPTFQKTARDGTLFYPRILDGYRIRLTGVPVSPSGDGVSVFLAKIIWAAAFPETLTITDGEIIRSNGNTLSTIPTAVVGEPKRVYTLIRDNQVEIIPDTTNKTAVYGDGTRMTLKDHVNGIGSTTPTPENVHGITLNDIPGGTAEPKAMENQKFSLARGIVDLTIPQNSPNTDSDALALTINQSTLTPTNLNATTITGSGINAAVKDAWVRVSDLETDQAAYLDGVKLIQVYPTLAETTDQTALTPVTDGWIGFSNVSGSADPVGTYKLFGKHATLDGADILLLQKEQVTGFPESISFDADELPLGAVYWDGSDIFRDYLAAQTASDPNENKAVDNRSIGLVGPQQLSTDLKNHPDEGGLSQEVLSNQVNNSNFFQDKVSTQFPSWTIVDTPAYLANASILQLLSTTDATLVTSGPGELTGVILTPTAGVTTGTTRLYAQIRKLKPNTTYTIAFFYKAVADWNSRTRVGINNGVAGAASVITTGSPSGSPLDVFVINDAEWRRASLVVKTNASVDPSDSTGYFLEFRFDATAATTIAGSPMKITSVSLTEGEWTPGYRPGLNIQEFSALAVLTPNGTTTVISTTLRSSGEIFDLLVTLTGEDSFLGGLGAFGEANYISTLEIDTVIVDTGTITTRQGPVAGVGVDAKHPLTTTLGKLGYLSPGSHLVEVKVARTTGASTAAIVSIVNQAKLRVKALG